MLINGIFLILLLAIPLALPFVSLFFGLKSKNRKTYLLLDILTQIICILPIGLFFVSMIFSGDGDLGPAVLVMGLFITSVLFYILVAQIVSLLTHLILTKNSKSPFILLKKVYLGILIGTILSWIIASLFYSSFGSSIAMLFFVIAFFGSPIYLVSLIIELLKVIEK
jgi:hypothetical protein